MREQTSWWLQTAVRDLEAVTERTHSGLELLSRLRQGGVKVSDDLFHQVRKLDRSDIDSRYPSGVAQPEPLHDQKTAEELRPQPESG